MTENLPTSDATVAPTTDLTHRITDHLQETFADGYQRGFREGFHIEDFPAWLDEEIDVCHLHYHAEDDPEEAATLRGMIRAYENAAHYLELRGVRIWGTSR